MNSMRKRKMLKPLMNTTPQIFRIFLLLVLFIGVDCKAAEARAENGTNPPVFSYLLGIRQPHAVESGL